MRFRTMVVALALGCQPASAAYLDIPPMSGDVTTPSGSSVATIAPGAVTASKLAGGAAAGNLGYAPGTWTIVSSSQTLTSAGRYKVTAAGVTIAIANAISGDLVIVDATASINPNITLTGQFDGQSGFAISIPHTSITVAWDQAASTYWVF